MIEADDIIGNTKSEYESYEKYTPLIDLQFKKGLTLNTILTLIIGAGIVLSLVSTQHYWWSALAVAITIGSCFVQLLDYTPDRVRIFKDGILASRHQIPWNGTWAWKQYPWSAILHIDLSERYFRIATIKESRSYGHVYTYMGKMEKKDKIKLINELKSHQQRGDIPSTVRFIE